jgi:hypothetical protein
MCDTRMLQPDLTQISSDLVGEFDTYDLESLREVLNRLWRTQETICVDLSAVTFLDLRCARELAIHSNLCDGRMLLRYPSWEAVTSLRVCDYGLLQKSPPRVVHNDA